MIGQQSRMFRYVSGPSSLRPFVPMSTPSELMLGFGRGEVTGEELITRLGAIERRYGLGTTLRVHNGDQSDELGSCCTDGEAHHRTPRWRCAGCRASPRALLSAIQKRPLPMLPAIGTHP